MTTPRIQTVATGITKEVIGVQTHMFYDPASQAVAIAFNGQPCLYVGETYSGVAGSMEYLGVDLSAIASQCYGQGTDPVTGADLTKISGAGLLAIVKAAFPVLWDAQVAAEAAQAAAETAA